MIRIRTFQILVVAATACYIVWFFLPYGVDYYLTDAEHRLAKLSGYGAVLPAAQHPIYSGVWFVLWLIAAIGLVFLQDWARHLYLMLSLLASVLILFSGFVVEPSLDALFSSVNLLLDGAILALVYLSPLADSFRETARNKRPSKKRRVA